MIAYVICARSRTATGDAVQCIKHFRQEHGRRAAAQTSVGGGPCGGSGCSAQAQGWAASGAALADGGVCVRRGTGRVCMFFVVRRTRALAGGGRTRWWSSSAKRVPPGSMQREQTGMIDRGERGVEIVFI